ncbi:MAG: hypothetical protein ABI402_16065 [Ferruginibacter sp.]
MKKIILSLLIFYSFSSFGQEVKAEHHMPVTLRDTATDYTYVLDSSHHNVTAFNSCGNMVWTVCPKLIPTGLSEKDFPLEIGSIGFYKQTQTITEKKMRTKN